MSDLYSIPLSALNPVWQAAFVAVKHKINALEASASDKIKPSISLDENNNPIKNRFLSLYRDNRKITRIDSMIECVEFSLKSFFGFGYNGAVTLLATIPALIRRSSQPIFPNVKTFWKKRVCIAGLSFINSVSGLIVLAKLTGFLSVISSIICYCKPTLRPTFDPINKVPDEDFQLGTAMALLELAVSNVDQKSIVDEINGLVTLILYYLKPKIIEKTSQANVLFTSKPTNLEDLEKGYNEKCSDIIDCLNKVKDLNGLKAVTFDLAKDVLRKVADVCHSKTISMVKQVPFIAKHVAQSIETVVEETSPKISKYYQKGFSMMKDSLNAANDKEDIRLAIGDFCTVISQIFSGLATSIQYEKNRCITEIRCSLEEEFFDAKDNQPWALER